MAAINFPDAPTNGQIFESGGMSWTYVAGIGWTLNSAIVEAGSGFTFIADTMPLPVNVGDTWFDSSTGASGGTSWVAVEEGPAGVSEKVWVQFAPGIGVTPNQNMAGSGLAAARPASVLPGYRYYATDTKRETLYDGTGWIVMSEPSQVYGVRVANINTGPVYGSYTRSNGWVDFHINSVFAAGWVIYSGPAFYLPFLRRTEPADSADNFTITFYDSAAGLKVGWPYVVGTETVGVMYKINSFEAAFIAPGYPFNWKTGDGIWVSGRYAISDKYAA